MEIGREIISDQANLRTLTKKVQSSDLETILKMAGCTSDSSYSDAILGIDARTMPPSKKNEYSYTEEAVLAACHTVRKEAKSIAQAAKDHGVPRTTLAARLRGRPSAQANPATVLTREEEGKIVKWLKDTSQRGASPTKQQLLSKVQTLLQNNKRRTPFKNNRPGASWFKLFMKRHSHIPIKLRKNRPTGVKKEECSDAARLDVNTDDSVNTTEQRPSNTSIGCDAVGPPLLMSPTTTTVSTSSTPRKLSYAEALDKILLVAASLGNKEVTDIIATLDYNREHQNPNPIGGQFCNLYRQLSNIATGTCIK